jgi:hypothetical protein
MGDFLNEEKRKLLASVSKLSYTHRNGSLCYFTGRDNLGKKTNAKTSF